MGLTRLLNHTENPMSFGPSSGVSLPSQAPQHKHHCVFFFFLPEVFLSYVPSGAPEPHSEMEVLQRDPWISIEAC